MAAITIGDSAAKDSRQPGPHSHGMVEYRGIVSATMIYDHLPINNHFHMIDEGSVLGLMDFKGY